MLVLVCYDVSTETKQGRRRLRRGAPEFDTKRDKLLIHIGRASNLPLQEGQLCVLGRFSDVQSL